MYPWFGYDIRDGLSLAVEHYALLRRLWREDVVDWEGRHRTPPQGFTASPAPSTACRRRRWSGWAGSFSPGAAAGDALAHVGVNARITTAFTELLNAS